MNPNEIYTHFLCQRHQFLLVQNIDANLRSFPKIEVTGVNVNNQVGTFQIFDDGIGCLFCHRSVLITRKDAVHIEVEVWDSPLYGVNTQRVEGGIDFHRSIQVFLLFVQQSGHEIAHHLAFQFIAVSSRHDADSLLSFTIADDVFSDEVSLVYGKLC